MADREFSNIYELWDALVEYTRRTPGCEVTSNDIPVERRLGFLVDTQVYWWVSVETTKATVHTSNRDLSMWMSSVEDVTWTKAYSELRQPPSDLQSMVKCRSGREALAKILTLQAPPVQLAPPSTCWERILGEDPFDEAF